jgi:hypothetical protein
MPALARNGIEWVHEEFSSQVESEENTPESTEVTLRGSPFTVTKLEEVVTNRDSVAKLIFSEDNFEAILPKPHSSELCERLLLCGSIEHKRPGQE